MNFYCGARYNTLMVIATFMLSETFLSSQKTDLLNTSTYFKTEELGALNKLNHTESEISITRKSRSQRKRAHFLICNQCFWCASAIPLDDSGENRGLPSACPSCNSQNLESMPLSLDEIYKFDYDQDRGVTLEFGKREQN
jgi:hypothetical protein